MPAVVLTSLYKKFRRVNAVDHIDLTVKHGQFVTLLGPSGCGKTTTLRLIAGFLKPDSGEIRVGDRVVSCAKKRINLAPEKRKMAMVFQSYALWPHMDILENVMFGLKVRKLPMKEARTKAMESLELVQLSHLAHRFPHQLSGGQQQRISFARAIATEPEVLLLDEPLSNLDAKLRESMRFELRQLHDQLNITTIYVTHDQAEAIILSDQICLMHEGKILQSCPPREIYDCPTCCTVADFIGTTNLMSATVGRDDQRAKGLLIRSGDFISAGDTIDLPDKTKVNISIRPESIRICAEHPGDKKNVLRGTIVTSAFVGNYVDYRVEVDGEIIRIQDFNTDVIHPQDKKIYLWINPDKVTILRE